MKTLKIVWLCFAILLFVVVEAIAQKTTGSTTPLPIDPNVKVGKLENGLTYYIRKNQKPENRAEIRLVVNAGSILENESQLGLAHFTEHMCFEGSTNFPKHELIDYFQKIGVKYGAELNAGTGLDETVYMILIPTDKEEYINKGFQALEDWAHNVSFGEKEIDKERGVISEEIRFYMGANDRMRKQYLPVILKGSRYPERMPLGKAEIIETFKRDTLLQFYKDWYRPNLQAVVIVGDIDPVKIEQKIIAHFSGIKNPEKIRERVIYDVPDNKEPLFSLVTDKEATGTTLMMFYKHPRKITKTISDYRTRLIELLATGMLNDRLNEITKQPEAPFTNAGTYYGMIFTRVTDGFLSSASLKENQIEKGLQTLLTESERMKRFGFTQTEFDRQKESLLSEYEQKAKEVDKTESEIFTEEYVNNFLNEEPIPGIKNELKYAKKFLPEITLDEVNNLAKAWVADENLVGFVTAPEKDNIKIPSSEQVLKIIAQVKQTTITPYIDKFKVAPLVEETLIGSKVTNKKENKELGFTELTLQNGVQVIIKPTDFKNDEVLLSAYSLGGLSLYPNSNFMSASFADQIINESGIGKFDNTELEKKLKGKIIEISPYISEIKEGFSGSAAPKDFETLMQLTYLYFKEPRKDTTAFKASMSNVKNQIKFVSQSPLFALYDTLMKIASQNDPRTIILPTEKQLNEVNLDTLYKIYKDRFADASDFKFFIVGNINIDSITPMLEKYLGSLPNINRKETWKDVSPEFPKGVTDFSINKGTEPQSKVSMIISESFDWNEKNKLDIRMLTEILRNQLNDVIREKYSGTYSAQIQIIAFDHYPKSEFALMIQFICAPKSTEKLTKAAFKVFSDLQKKGPSDKDITKAKELLIRERETDLKKNNFWLNKIESTYFNNDSFELILNYTQRVNDVTKEDMKKAAQLYLKKDHYVRGVLYPEKKK